MRFLLRLPVVLLSMVICFITTLIHMVYANLSVNLTSYLLSNTIYRKNPGKLRKVKEQITTANHQQQSSIVRFFCRVFVLSSSVKVAVYQYRDCKRQNNGDLSTNFVFDSSLKGHSYFAKKDLFDDVLIKSSNRELCNFIKKLNKKNHQGPFKPSPLILSNHISFVDVLVIGSIIPTTFVAKSDVEKWPVIGHFVKWAGIIFLNRQSMVERYKSLFRIKRRLNSTSVCIFPEATTTSSLIPRYDLWQSGNIWTALYKVNKKTKNHSVQCLTSRSGVSVDLVSRHNDVITISLCYRNRKENAWVDDISFVDLLFAMLKRQRTEMILIWSSMESQCHQYNQSKKTDKKTNINLRQFSMKIYTRIAIQCLSGNRMLNKSS